MKTSILIATHNRNHVLKWNLQSIATQQLSGIELEVLVLDDRFEPDNECVQLVESFKSKLNIKHIHSGKTKNGKNLWRVPGYAYNIGAKQSTGDILIICCGEMYHVGKTIQFIHDQITQDKNLLCTINGADDRDGTYLKMLNEGKQITADDCRRAPFGLTVSLPFCMGVSRQHFFDVGGYDESFTGMCYEDDDLIVRLQRNGCKLSHSRLPSPTFFKPLIAVPDDLYLIHLFTPHIKLEDNNKHLISYNEQLFKQNNANNKKIANTSHEWGKM